MSVTISVRPEARSRSDVRTAPLSLTATLAAVLVAATLYGLFADGYRETSARELLGATLRGQDALTL